MTNHKLTHLKELEAESIHIIREVAAEFDRPVMLYSVGKDSAVMLHLTRKAFYPGKPPFPLMHVDTTWKFKEMIKFRDNYIKELGWDLLVHSNQEGIDQGVGPFTHGSKKHTDIMKTQALKQGLNKYKFDAAFGGARRDEEKSRAKERVYSFRDKNHGWDPKTSALSYGIFITAGLILVKAFESSLFLTGLSWMYGNIFIWKIYRFQRFTLLKNAPLSIKMAC